MILFGWPNLLAAQDQFSVDGNSYEIRNGAVFILSFEGLRHFMNLYDPLHVRNSYVHKNGKTYRVHPNDGKLYETQTLISDDFEAAALPDLVGPGLEWTGFTLQSPAAPTVSDYVALRRQVLAGAPCIDNCLRTFAFAHSGAQALEAIAYPPGGGTSVSKSAIENGLLYAGQGDTITFSGWFYLSEGRPVSLVDFEASYIEQGPGVRVMVDGRGRPWVELKWGSKPGWHPATDISLPQKEWFKLAMEVDLHRYDGHVRLFLNDRIIVTGHGQTLPLADAIIDRVEVGITATTGSYTVLYVDDVLIEVR